jgi:hypothetical protein
MVAQKALAPSSPYQAWFQEAERLADRFVESSPITFEQIARTIHRALTADRPKLRYLIGHRARLFFALRRYLPGDLFDRLYATQVVRRVSSGGQFGHKRA